MVDTQAHAKSTDVIVDKQTCVSKYTAKLGQEQN